MLKGNFMKKLILSTLVLATLFTSSSYAELAIGGYFGVNQALPGSVEQGSYKGKQGTEFGVVLLWPLFPTLSLRASLAQKIRKTNYSGTFDVGGPIVDVDANISETLTDLGLGVQWSLPVTDLYLMGGAKVSTSQSITCSVNPDWVVMSNCAKTKTDYPVFVGFGYSFFTLTPVKVSIEGEYERGTSSNFLGTATSGVTARLVFTAGL